MLALNFTRLNVPEYEAVSKASLARGLNESENQCQRFAVDLAQTTWVQFFTQPISVGQTLSRVFRLKSDESARGSRREGTSACH